MLKPEDLWHDARARVRIKALCDELKWDCRFQAWECHIRPEEHGAPIYATWRRLGETPWVEFTLPLFEDPYPQVPLNLEIFEFILRRNADLVGVNWCISRYEGVSVRAVCAVETLSMEKLHAAVVELVAERETLLALSRVSPVTKGNDAPRPKQ